MMMPTTTTTTTTTMGRLKWLDTASCKNNLHIGYRQMDRQTFTVGTSFLFPTSLCGVLVFWLQPAASSSRAVSSIRHIIISPSHQHISSSHHLTISSSHHLIQPCMIIPHISASLHHLIISSPPHLISSSHHLIASSHHLIIPSHHLILSSLHHLIISSPPHLISSSHHLIISSSHFIPFTSSHHPIHITQPSMIIVQWSPLARGSCLCGRRSTQSL